jgi:hypothetical protein
VNGPTPLLDIFRRGEAAPDVRLLAAQGALAPRAHEQVAILALLLEDSDPEIRRAADDTLNLIPGDAMRAFLARSDVPTGLRELFRDRGVVPDPAVGAPAGDLDLPLIDTGPDPAEVDDEDDGKPDKDKDGTRKSVVQQLTDMSFTDRLKAAVKGSKEMRSILIRDPNKMIAASVLSSPKLSASEVEGFARMSNVSEDVLRIIGGTRAWTKNYGVIVALTKNSKTPIALSITLLARLADRDLAMLAVDRNVPEQVRIAARRKVVEATSRK